MRRTVLPALGIAALALSACSPGQPNSAVRDVAAPTSGDHATSAPATTGTSALAKGGIVDPSGKSIGSVEVTKGEHGLTVHVAATAMTPGFHGLHVHAVGKCEPKSADPKDPAKTGDFLSSGGHLAGGGMDHPEHTGDLPVLYVMKDGTGHLTTVTDRLTEEQLGQAGGISFIVHAGPDNYGNIPTRYAAGGPDAETKKAGDSGARIGCAVLAKS